MLLNIFKCFTDFYFTSAVSLTLRSSCTSSQYSRAIFYLKNDLAKWHPELNFGKYYMLGRIYGFGINRNSFYFIQHCDISLCSHLVYSLSHFTHSRPCRAAIFQAWVVAANPADLHSKARKPVLINDTHNSSLETKGFNCVCK